ncbi:hypothetical protein HBA55_04495 [Pseudomaricurvus alkylphenolicus]|uniref:hypothetical protein n=1 Tax=Pseudomaricurvus alkylphenolicus TaxID=1306991 RepID=UPI00141F5FDA|nr:hypothetical protein [Pseudomaricurvus alkylphenolicus]NIB38831.1 hypothetical protein [Pseudomaricurvus alkylphenolicus]
MLSVAITKKTQIACVWAGVAFFVLTLIGLGLLANYIPPPSPSLSAIEVKALFENNLFLLRVGMVLLMFAAAMYLPFTAVTAVTIARVEGGVGVMTITQVLAGFTNMILFFYPPLWWLTAAFRMDRSPELILLLNDAAWLQYMGALAPFLFIQATLAWAAFVDKRPNPIFPRWFGYLNLWVIVLFLPGQLLFFFHDGPFAWNGIFGWWIPLFNFFGWCSFLIYFVRRSVLSDSRQAINSGINPATAVGG